MMTFRPFILFNASLAALLLALAAGCGVGDTGSREEAEEQIARAQEEIATRNRGGIRQVDVPWYGEAPPSRGDSGNGKPLPARTERHDSIVVTLSEPSSIDTVMPLLATASGIPVDWVPVSFQGAGAADRTVARPTTLVRINHHGKLSTLLDRLARTWDIAWDYDGHMIRLQPEEVRYYDVPVPVGSTSFSSSASGLAGFGGSSLNTSSSADLSPWQEMEEALTAIPGATVQMQSSAGRVIVAARPSVQRLVEQQIEAFRTIYGQRVAIEVTTWFLSVDKMNEAGLGLSLLFNDGNALVTLGDPAAAPEARTGGVRIIGDDSAWQASEAFFSAAASAGAVVDRVQANTLTLAGVMSPIVLGRERQFVTGTTSETTTNPTTGQSVTTRSPEIEEVISGISLFVLPRVLAGERVHLSVWINQQQLVTTHSLPSGDGGTVVLPETDGRNLSWIATMPAGARLVLGGYEQEMHDFTDVGSGRPDFWLFGGRSGSSSTRVQMVITVRPTLLGPG